MASKRTIGKYEVIDRLGRGGMAEVYRAYHANLDRYVAIKVLHAFLADDPEFRTRFSGEARNIARLKHPHIVQVYDFDFDEEVENYFMVMELVDGPTLKDLLTEHRDKGEAFSLSETLRIVRQSASALSYAHKDGMIHRDVKPANLMIDKDNRLVLTDFGIAKMMSTPQSTLTGGMVGTPAYMSPEQGTGDLGDERSDLYALGVIMYEMLTGELPYIADTPLGVIMKHANEPIPSVSETRPHLPRAVDVIVKKLMAKLPENRYQTADELIVDIDKFTSALRRSSTITNPTLKKITQTVKAVTNSTPTEAILSTDVESSQLRLKTVLEDAQIRRTQNIQIQQEPKRRTLWLLLLLIIIVIGIGGYFVGVSNGNFPAISALLNPTSTPSPTVTLTTTPTNSPTVTPTPTETNSSTPTVTPSQTATGTATNTPTIRPSATPTFSSTPSPTFTPSLTPTLTSTPTITTTPSPTNSPIPTATPNTTLTVAVAQTATTTACKFDYAIVEQDPADGEEGGFYRTNSRYTRNVTLLNTGSCAWGPNTSLTFLEGTNFNIGPRVFIRETVNPAAEVILVIEATLPSRGGLHESTWELRTPGQIPIGGPLEINVQVFDPGPGG